MADHFSQIQWWLQSGSFGLVNNDGARRLRNEKQADWLEEVCRRLYTGRDSVEEDAKPASTAAAGHTVESMVEELAQRVGLQGLEKQAEQGATKTASVKIPLSKAAQQSDAPKKNKSPEQLLREMKQYLITYQLRPTHGLGPAEASYNALKEKFGPDTVQELGRDIVMKMIEQTHKQAAEPNLADTLPKYDGSPTPLKSDTDSKMEQLDLGGTIQQK